MICLMLINRNVVDYTYIMQKKIVGVLGFIGSGKGTVGDYLVNQYGFKSASYAHSLKDAVASIFDWPRHLLEGDTAESRAWREVADLYWSNKMKKPITPRWVLQHVGTDVLRHHFEDNIWIWSLEKKLAGYNHSTVVTDVRFPNEIKMLQNMNATLIWVRRNPEPQWADNALLDIESVRAISSVHPSEYEWINVANYNMIWNNGTLDDLYRKVDQCVNL